MTAQLSKWMKEGSALFSSDEFTEVLRVVLYTKVMAAVQDVLGEFGAKTGVKTAATAPEKPVKTKPSRNKERRFYKGSVPGKVVAYVDKHPGSTITNIYKALGLTRAQAYSAMRRLTTDRGPLKKMESYDGPVTYCNKTYESVKARESMRIEDPK